MVDNVPGVGGFFLDADGEADALRRHRALADAIDDGIYELDADGRFVAANAAFAALTGRDREDLLGSHASVAFDEADVDRAEAATRALRSSGGDAVTLDVPVATADGDRVPCELRVSPVRQDGEFRGTVGVVRADPDRRTVGRGGEGEREGGGEREGEGEGGGEGERERGGGAIDDRYARLVDDVPGMVYRCRNERGWPMEFVSDGVAEVAGYEAERVESGAVSWGEDVIHPDDRERVWEAVQEGLGRDGSFIVQYRVRTPDGDVRWVWERGRGVDGDEGDVTALEGIITDVTEHERTEQGLVESEQRFRSLVQAVEEYAIFMLDPDGRVVSWNDGAERIKGYAAGDIVGEHFSRFYTEDDRAAGVPEANLTAALDHGVVEDEGWRVREDGSRFWANVTITAVRDDDGELEGFAKITRDMTDRREREQRLREEKAFVESLFDAMPDLVYAFGLDEQFVRWNDRVPEVTGYADEAIGEMHPLEFVADEATDRAMAAIEAVVEEGAVRTIEAPLETADGDRIPYQFSGAPIVDDGSVVGLTGTGRDVSQLKAQARRLERQRDELEAELAEVFERVDDGFYALDDDMRFTYLNQRAAELLGRDGGELLGASIREAFPDEEGSAFVAAFRRAMETQEPATVEEFYPAMEAWLEIRAYPSESGLSVYFRDVTERVERERELEEYATVIETMNDGVYVVDADGEFVMVNEAYAEMMGYSREELLGSHVSLVADEETIEAAGDIEADLRAGTLEEATLEAELLTADGDRFPAEATFALLPAEGDGDPTRVGVVRDVTERKARERELETRVRQQEVVTDLGRRALEDRDVDALMAEAARLVAETLDTDYCKVLDLDGEAGELLLRQGVGWDEGVVGEATVSAVEDDSQAAYTLTAGEPVVVEDLATEPRFGGPDLLTSHDVESGISTVVGPPDDPWGILGTHDADHRTFSEQDVNFVQSVANILASALERRDDERELLHQRERLAALNNLNAVVREITEAAIEQSTREEIERTVCEALASADSYEFAWMGEVEGGTDEVVAREEAGVEGYLEDADISVDPDDPLSRGPTGRAVLTREMQVTDDVLADEDYEPWLDRGREHGFRSSAAIPVVHEGTLYGVLNVYADRPGAFSGEEREVVGQLGEIVGHAIAAVERKRALTSDEVIELDFRVEDVFSAFDLPVETDDRITVDRTVPAGDDEYLVFGRTTEEGLAAVEAIVETVPHWESMRVVGGRPDETRFEVRLGEPPVLTALSSRGGYVESACFEEGDYHMTVQLPHSIEVREVVEVVQNAYPDAEVRAQRQVTRSDEGFREAASTFQAELTDRQRAVLESAYFAGYFEWPRESSGEEIAGSLDIAPATFSQHLRTAEKRIFGALFESEAAG